MGRDLRVSNVLSMLAEAEQHIGQCSYVFVEDVVYGDRAVLRPILIDELCTRGRCVCARTRVIICACTHIRMYT